MSSREKLERYRAHTYTSFERCISIVIMSCWYEHIILPSYKNMLCIFKWLLYLVRCAGSRIAAYSKQIFNQVGILIIYPFHLQLNQIVQAWQAFGSMVEKKVDCKTFSNHIVWLCKATSDWLYSWEQSIHPLDCQQSQLENAMKLFPLLLHHRLWFCRIHLFHRANIVFRGMCQFYRKQFFLLKLPLDEYSPTDFDELLQSRFKTQFSLSFRCFFLRCRS